MSITKVRESNKGPKNPKLNKVTKGKEYPVMRECELSEDELIKAVRETQEGYIIPGKKISGLDMFLINKNPKLPKKDFVYLWRQLYIRCIDEYDFALKALGDWGLYQRLKSCAGYLRNVLLPEWEEERILKLRTQALKEVVNDIENGNVSSAKWLEKHLSQSQDDTPKTKTKPKKDTKQIDTIMSSIEDNWKDFAETETPLN